MDELLQMISEINPVFLLGLFLLQTFTLLLVSYQWHFMFKNNEYDISFHEVFTIHMAGKFVESVTPSSKFGGETAKVYLFRKKIGRSYQDIVSFLLAHKYISLLPFLILSLIFLVTASIQFSLPRLVYISFIAMVLLFVMLFALLFWGQKKYDYESDRSKKHGIFITITDKIKRGIEFLHESASGVEKILSRAQRNKLFVISFLIWILYPIKIYLVAASLNFEIGLLLPIIATYSAYLVSMLPITPGGLGTFEGTMASIFMISELSFTEGMTIALLSRSVTFWFPLFLSAICTTYLVKIEDLTILSMKEASESQ